MEQQCLKMAPKFVDAPVIWGVILCQELNIVMCKVVQVEI